MLSKVPLKANQVERIRGEYPDAEPAAREYEEALVSRFKLRVGELPRSDLLLAGMGNEGHTLSLFPGSRALHADRRIAVRNWVGKLFAERITLALRCLGDRVPGDGRGQGSGVEGRVLEGPHEPEQLPAQLLQAKDGKLLWLVDTAAGSMLSKGIRE